MAVEIRAAVAVDVPALVALMTGNGRRLYARAGYADSGHLLSLPLAAPVHAV